MSPIGLIICYVIGEVIFGEWWFYCISQIFFIYFFSAESLQNTDLSLIYDFTIAESNIF